MKTVIFQLTKYEAILVLEALENFKPEKTSAEILRVGILRDVEAIVDNFENKETYIFTWKTQNGTMSHSVPIDAESMLHAVRLFRDRYPDDYNSKEPITIEKAGT